jgi:hypothetical protein
MDDQIKAAILHGDIASVLLAAGPDEIAVMDVTSADLMEPPIRASYLRFGNRLYMASTDGNTTSAGYVTLDTAGQASECLAEQLDSARNAAGMLRVLGGVDTITVRHELADGTPVIDPAGMPADAYHV